MNRYGYKGRHLFLKRARLGLGQGGFAKSLGISQATVSRWENQWKERLLDEDMAARLHSLSIPDELGLVLYSPPDRAGAPSLLGFVQRLMPHVRRFVRRFIHGWRGGPYGQLPKAQLPARTPAPAGSSSQLVIHEPALPAPHSSTGPSTGPAPSTPSEPVDDQAPDEGLHQEASHSRPGNPPASAIEKGFLLIHQDMAQFTALFIKCFAIFMVAFVLAVALFLRAPAAPPGRPVLSTQCTPPPEETRMGHPDGGIVEIPGWIAPEEADGGTPVLPPADPQRFKGQKLPPCDSHHKEVEVVGACWWEMAGAPPCAEQWMEINGKCLMPIPARRPPPPAANTPSP